MEHLVLRYPNGEQADRRIGPGVHLLGPDGNLAGDGATALCLDRRGAWLRLGEGAPPVHVNGRPVRRMAMLRVGDTLWLGGTGILLLPDDDPAARAPARAGDGGSDPRIVLRGVGGQHHGRCFGLERALLVGRGADCDIRVDDPAFPERHARLELDGAGVALRGLSDQESIVNGQAVRDAWLRPGDQLVFDDHHRFVVEWPGRPRPRPDAPPPQEVEAGPGLPGTPQPPAGARAARRLPWLLLAALLIAAAISALLLSGPP
ncbi:MAG: FHA domain-containing protein [Gammaproteobacteria bacterium]